jgi:hypothetical protein
MDPTVPSRCDGNVAPIGQSDHEPASASLRQPPDLDEVPLEAPSASCVTSRGPGRAAYSRPPKLRKRARLTTSETRGEGRSSNGGSFALTADRRARPVAR